MLCVKARVGVAVRLFVDDVLSRRRYSMLYARERSSCVFLECFSDSVLDDLR